MSEAGRHPHGGRDQIKPNIQRHPMPSETSSVIQRHPQCHSASSLIQRHPKRHPTLSKTSSYRHPASFCVIQRHPTVIQTVIQRNPKRHPSPKTSSKGIQTGIQRHPKCHPKSSKSSSKTSSIVIQNVFLSSPRAIQCHPTSSYTVIQNVIQCHPKGHSRHPKRYPKRHPSSVINIIEDFLIFNSFAIQRYTIDYIHFQMTIQLTIYIVPKSSSGPQVLKRSSKGPHVQAFWASG